VVNNNSIPLNSHVWKRWLEDAEINNKTAQNNHTKN